MYKANADAYIANLKELDQAIAEQVKTIPPERRKHRDESRKLWLFRRPLRIPNHRHDRAQREHRRRAIGATNRAAHRPDQAQSGARVIFLETGANPQLAKQIAQETGVRVVTDLYTHSLTDAQWRRADIHRDDEA